MAEAIGAAILSAFTVEAAVGATVIVGSLTVNAAIGTAVILGTSLALQSLLSPEVPRYRPLANGKGSGGPCLIGAGLPGPAARPATAPAPYAPS